MIEILERNVDRHGLRPTKLSAAGQCCLGCAVCTVFFVLAAVPIAALIIMPVVAQHTLDATIIGVPNATIVPCSSARAMLVNTATFSFAGPLSARVRAEKVTLSAVAFDTKLSMQSGGSCEDIGSTELGSYTIPDVRLIPGNNTQHFTIGVELMNLTLWTEQLIIPLFMKHCGIALTIASDDVIMVTSGVKQRGLSIKRQLTCSPARSLLQKQSLSHICGPASEGVSGRRLHDDYGYTLHCTESLQRSLTMVV